VKVKKKIEDKDGTSRIIYIVSSIVSGPAVDRCCLEQGQVEASYKQDNEPF
jgi:hypothetical protein